MRLGRLDLGLLFGAGEHCRGSSFLGAGAPPEHEQYAVHSGVA